MVQIVDDNLSLYVRVGNIAALEEVSVDDLRNNVMSPAIDTALHLAASEGQFDSFKVIFRKCPALLHRLDGDGYTPLHVAVNSRQYEIVKMLTTTELLEKEDDRECERKDKHVPNKRLLRMLSTKGETALLRAVYLEYIEMVKLLSEADPEFQHPGDWSKKTPLEQSLTTGSSTILHQLLKACPASAFGGMVTLAKGARRVLKRETLDYFKRIDCLKVIYRRYPSLAYYQYKWGETTFHRAARRGQTEIIRCLIYTSSKPPYHDKEETDFSKQEEEQEENPDEKLLRMVNKDKDTALHLAVKEKQFDVVKLITETTPGKKLVCMVNEELDTPLHLAVRNDHLEISKLLIKAYPHKELLRMVDLNKDNALHLAIGTQNLELIKLLIAADLDNELVTIGDKSMNAALHLAVQKRDIELVTFFLASSNSDRKLLTLVNEDKDTALHLAVHSGVFQVVKILVAADIDNVLVGMVDKNSYTALHLAVESQHIEMVKFLIEGDYGKELVRMGDKNKNTALHLAVKRHNASIVKLLLADPEHNKKLVRMVNDEKETALHLAVRSKLLEVVKSLIEAEPDKEFLRMVNKKKNTALHLAIQYQYIELVKVLTEADNDKELARMGDMNHNTALHLAIKGNDLEVVEYFLTKRMDTKILRLVTMDRDSALHLAVHNHSFELVKLLISADPKKELVRMVDKNKNTALHLAVGYEHLEMVKVLIAADTDDRDLVKMGDKDKNTALHLAVKINNHEIVECLTQIADPVNMLVRMVNKDKDTALHLAVQDSLADIVQLLTLADREYEYSPNNAGVTPLYMAVAKGSCDIVEKILEVCPSSSYSGPNGDTALRSTLVRGNSDIRKLLLEKQPNQCKEIGEHGWTSLHYATKIGDTNAVKDIIRSCPSCTKLVDNDGRNFLHLAAIHKHVDIVKHALHSREISSNVLNKKDNYGYTPLHIAAETGNRNLVLPLLQNDRVNKMTENAKGDKVLDAITFEYDKEKIGVHGVRDRMNEKELKEQRDFDLVVCALIATISFTAGITVPGGYINDGPNQGTAVLRKNIFFEAFLVTNAFSLLFSLTAAFSHFCTRRLLKKKDILFHSTLATFCTLGAIFATMVSFIVGSFAVLTASSRIAIVVCVICSSFFFFAFYAMWRMAMQYRQPAR